MKYFNFYITVFIALTAISLNAQTDVTTHFMRSNPYSNYENPASYLPFKGYVGFPCVGNLNVNLSNTAFHYNNILKRDSEGYPVSVTLDKFIDKLHKTENWLNLSLNEEILGFGFRTKGLFFSFSYRVKIEEYFKFSKAIFELPIKGNMNFLGEDNPANLNANLSLNAYQEFSLGVQAEIGKRIYIGARPKFLFGLANINTNKLNANIFTDPDSYEIRVNYAADITAVCAFPDLSFDNGLLLNFSDWHNLFDNKGFALDLGGFFRINDHFGVGAAFNNIGFINWKTQGIKITSALSDQGQFYHDGDFLFKGLNADQILDLIDGSSSLLDSVLQYFPVNFEEYISGKRWLNTRFNIEGYFQLNPTHRLSAFFQGTIIGKNFYPRFTVAYSGKFGNIFEICLNYSMMPSSYSNFGVGLGLTLGPIYLYAATDNIIGVCTPLNTNTLNAQVGLAFKFGKVPEKVIKKPKESKEEITVEGEAVTE